VPLARRARVARPVGRARARSVGSARAPRASDLTGRRVAAVDERVGHIVLGGKRARLADQPVAARAQHVELVEQRAQGLGALELGKGGARVAARRLLREGGEGQVEDAERVAARAEAHAEVRVRALRRVKLGAQLGEVVRELVRELGRRERGKATAVRRAQLRVGAGLDVEHGLDREGERLRVRRERAQLAQRAHERAVAARALRALDLATQLWRDLRVGLASLQRLRQVERLELGGEELRVRVRRVPTRAEADARRSTTERAGASAAA
jgi:hypothetical protein